MGESHLGSRLGEINLPRQFRQARRGGGGSRARSRGGQVRRRAARESQFSAGGVRRRGHHHGAHVPGRGDRRGARREIRTPAAARRPTRRGVVNRRSTAADETREEASIFHGWDERTNERRGEGVNDAGSRTDDGRGRRGGGRLTRARGRGWGSSRRIIRPTGVSAVGHPGAKGVRRWIGVSRRRFASGRRRFVRARFRL